MRIIEILISCTTEREYFKTLGNVLVAQKLLNDYLSVANNRGVGPEGFSEEWFKENKFEGPIKDSVSRFFFSSLQIIGNSES